MSTDLLLLIIYVSLCLLTLVSFGYSFYIRQRVRGIGKERGRIRELTQEVQSLQSEVNNLRNSNESLKMERERLQTASEKDRHRLENLSAEVRELRLQVAELEARQKQRTYVSDETGVVTTLESWRANNLR